MKYTNTLKVESITFSELLQYNLKIPEYQRPYTWTFKEINKLQFQFIEHQEREETDKPNFYLGSIVLHKDGEKYNIIDGQQRITTMQILDLIKNQNTFNISYTHPISFNRIKENFEFYKDKELSFPCLGSINVTVVITDSEDIAYNFFETLNTGGKRLGGTDILKAYHLRGIKENAKRNCYALKWEKNQKNLEKVNRAISKIRRMDYFNEDDLIPRKSTNDDEWKNILTDDFAARTKKQDKDIGYSFVLSDDTSHTITSAKYAVRQPINEGINYINYLMGFTEEYNFLFEIKDNNDQYSDFTSKVINFIDGTEYLKHFYELSLLCFVNRFGRENILEFSLYLFRVVYSLRLNHLERIQESTVLNFMKEKKLLDRIINAFTYDEILTYLKEFKLNIKPENITGGVKERFYNRICRFFNNCISKENYDKELFLAIESYLNTTK